MNDKTKLGFAVLIDTIASRTGHSKATTRAALETLVDITLETLSDGGEVTLPGLGKFYVVDVAERPGRNPSTGAAMTLPAHKSAKFKAGKMLKDAVNFADDFKAGDLDHIPFG